MEAVRWLVAAARGEIPRGDVADRFTESLRARGDVVGLVTRSRRLAAWRGAEAPAVVDGESRGPYAIRAVLAAGESRWEVDLAVEHEPPYRITRLVPRAPAPGAVPWATLQPLLETRRNLDTRLASPARESLGHLLGVFWARHPAPALGVAIVRDGEVVHRELLGTPSPSGTDALLGSSVFQVGSVAKAITALGVLALAEQGTVRLDAAVGEVVPTLELVPLPGDRSPRITDLLVHDAGLAREIPRESVPAMLAGADLVDAAPRLLLERPVGGSPAYSNLGYEVLGEVIRSVTGAPYAEVLESTVLAPLGMTGSRMARAGAVPDTVPGHAVVAGTVGPEPHRPVPHRAAGGMTSTLDDLVRLACALAAGIGPGAAGLLDQRAALSPTAAFVPGMGVVDRGGRTLLWRAGSTPGFTADLRVDVATGRAVVAAWNSSPPASLHDLGDALLDVLDGQHSA